MKFSIVWWFILGLVSLIAGLVLAVVGASRPTPVERFGPVGCAALSQPGEAQLNPCVGL